MALSPANLLINFISNYAGCHRICYRTGGAGPYTCTSCQPCSTNCNGNGAPCTATIPIMVDNDSCVPEDWNGYVQACCEDEASTNGRTPFDIQFVPNPNCKGYNISCDSGFVYSIDIINGGAGYDATPGETLITIDAPTGAGPIQATATPIIVGQIITGITINNPGAGYIVVPNVTVSCLTPGPCPPFAPQTPAVLAAVIRCSPIADAQIGYSCNQITLSPSINPGLVLGQNFNNCYNVAQNPLPVLPTGYGLTLQGCCFDCVTIDISASSGSVDYRYTECTTGDVVTGTHASGSPPVNACVVNNSWMLTETDPLNPVGVVIVGAACP